MAATYGTAAGVFQEVRFAPLTTRCLRAVLDASQGGGTYAGVGVQEWEVLAPKPREPTPAPKASPPACANL